jgi:HUS1 checkpoint protein
MIHLTPKQVQFIVINDVTDGFQVWSGMNVESLFGEYLIESLNNNVIALEVELDQLLKALKSGSGAHDITMKLTKKLNPQGAFLSFGIQVNQHQSIVVVQDVPVTVMTQEQFQHLSEPRLPEPDVYIMLPSAKQLRPIVEHMKNVDQYLHVTANMNGELTLKVETEMFTVGSFFHKLEHPRIDGAPAASVNPDKVASVKVDIKKFHKSLYSYQVAAASIVCCMFEKQALVLHLLIGDLFVTYYIPVLDTNTE